MIVTAANDTAGRLQRLVDREADKEAIHSIIAGMRTGDGRVDVGVSAGTADSAGSSMTPQTPYYLASITKTYTAVVVLTLSSSGKIDLDAPIGTYLPNELTDGLHVVDDVDYGAQVTVAQLLNQTSGLADYFEGAPEGGVSLVDDLKQNVDRALSIQDIVEIVRGLPPEFAPGADQGRKAHYSDTNYALLGAIVEAVADKRIGELFEEMIFQPLGLADTYAFDHELDQPTPAAMYYKDQALEIPLAMSSFAPDGGLVSTLADSLRFLQALFGGELVTQDQLGEMTKRWNRIMFPLRYGSGLMLFKLPRWVSFRAPPEFVGHSGSTGSFAFYNPERDVYLAGTVNQMDQPARPFRLMTKMVGFLD